MYEDRLELGTVIRQGLAQWRLWNSNLHGKSQTNAKIQATWLYQRQKKNGEKPVACVVFYNLPYMERP